MTSTLRRIFGLLLVAITLQGCAATPFYGRPMTNRIVNDTTAFNKAYAEASNAQILLNILYSRDRLPRQYAGFKDITTTQTRTLGVAPQIGGIPLGNPASRTNVPITTQLTSPAKLFGTGQISATAQATASPNYGLSPIVGEALNKAAFSATSPAIFINFWEAGWPRDVLMTVLVQELRPLKRICPPKPENDRQRQILRDLATAENEQSLFTASQDYYRQFSAELRSGTKCDLDGSLEIFDPEVLIKNSVDDYHPSNSPKIVTPCGSQSEDTVLNCARYFRYSDISNFRINYVALSRPSQKGYRFELPGLSSGVIREHHWEHFANGLAKLEEAKVNYKFLGRDTVTLSDDKIEISQPASSTKQLIITKVADRTDDDEKKCKEGDFDYCDKRWGLKLRSFDQAVYFLGELLRIIPNNNEYERFGPDEVVKNADGNNALVPLFQVYRVDQKKQFVGFGPRSSSEKKFAESSIWAGKVLYGGNWYYAGPASPLVIDDDDNKIDRSATVMTLLGQLFELNRSPESLQLPARLQP